MNFNQTTLLRRCAPGAVEGGDGIPVLFRVLEELVNIVSGDNTNGNIAGSNHYFG